MFEPQFKSNILLYKLDFVSRDPNLAISNYECDFCFIKESYEYLEKSKFVFLSNAEIINLSKYEFRKKRYDYLLGRAAIKSILQKHQICINDYSIFNKITGKPFINDDELGISISHSGGSACGITYSYFLEVSIDMEYIINVDENTSFSFWLKNEENAFQNLDIINDRVKNTINWSAKESLAKFIGTGFNIVYEILEISSVEQIDENILSISYKNIKIAQTIVLIFDSLVISLTIPCSIKIKNIESFFQHFSKYYRKLIDPSMTS